MLRGCEWVDRCRRSFLCPKKVHPNGKGDEYPPTSEREWGGVHVLQEACVEPGEVRLGSGKDPQEGTVHGSRRRRRRRRVFPRSRWQAGGR